MTDMDTIEQPVRKRNALSIIFKTIFVLAALVMIGLTVMANIGGNSETLKKSIEEFIGENTPYNAHIGRLNNMTFFPNISFDFEDTEFYHPQADSPVISLSSLHISLGFWDVMTGTGKIKIFEIKGLRALPSTILPTAAVIDSASILDSDSGPRFEVTGTLNNRPVFASVTMEAQGKGRNKKFYFSEQRALEIHLDDIKITGQMQGRDNGITINNLSLASPDKEIAGGTLDMDRGRGRIMVDGQISFREHQSDLNPHIEIDRVKNEVEGVVKSREFHLKDFSRDSGYGHVMNILEEMFLPRNTPAKITLDAAGIYKNGTSQGSYNGPLVLEGWRIDTEAIKPASP